MEKRKIVLMTIVIFVVGLIIAGSSYAFWSWNSSVNKNVVFNTANNLKNYIVYNEGESAFTGELNVSNDYQTGGIHSTISIYKTTNVNLLATIHMDINQIGESMKNSSALKWVVTEGTTSNVGAVLAKGNFIGTKSGDVLTLVPDINVTTTETFYTIWIWLDSSANPSDNLSGETLDTNVWTEINQVEGAEDRYEVTNTTANYQAISATVVDSKYKVTHYAVTTTNSEPTSWTTITPETDQAKVYNLNTTVNNTGTYYIWFKDESGRTKSKEVEVTTVDTSKPSCNWGAFTPVKIANGVTSTVTLTCTDNESGISVHNLQTTDFTPSNNRITISNMTKEIVTNGYKYTITVTGTTNDGTSHLTLAENKVINGVNLGNNSTSSGDITVENIISVSDAVVTLEYTSTTYNGSAKTPSVTVTKNGTTLTKDTDYTVTYTNNTNVGTATVTITGINNYGGETTKTFTISYNSFNITLDNANATTNGTSTIYMRYADGVYLNNTYTTKMTTSANPIATLPQRTGYTFAGYYDGSTQMIDATGKITSAFTNTKYSAAKTLNAHWTANTYTVTYDDNRFDTYSMTKNGLTITYDSGNHELTINGTQSATITLQNVLHNFIEGDEYKATLTYISGTVSSSDDSNYLLCNDVRSADASSIQMQYCLKPPATSVNTVTKTITADAATNGKILYTMLWVASSNKVTYTNYKMKVDFTKVESKSVTYNSTYGTLPAPTRTGYTFNGWYTAESGGTQVTSSTTVTNASSHTLYAVWTPKTYTVTYNKNTTDTVSNMPSPTTYTYAPTGNTNLSSNTPVRTGYTFLGWSLSSTATTATYPVSSNWALSNAETDNYQLYAVWRASTYTVTYDDNRFNTYNSGLTINGVSVTYAASTHQLTLNGTQSGSVYLQHPTHTFTEGDKYKITLTYISGSLTSTSRQVLCLQLMKKGNASMPSLRQTCPALPTSSNTTTSGTLTISADDASTANVLFDYLWYDSSGTVSYSNYVVKVDITKVDSKSVTYNSTYGTLPTPTRIGYTFNGWYTSESGGTQVTSSTTVTTSSDHTLYAHWTKNTYLISYVLNGGTHGETHPDSATYDTRVALSNPTKTVTVTGNANSTGASVGSATSATQTFDGWTSNANTNTARYGTNNYYIASAWNDTTTKLKNNYYMDLTTTNNASVTMTANWTPVAVTLPTLSKTGNTCNYYTTSGTSGGSLMGAGGASWTPGATSNAAVTAYARCSANQYTITYNANGGSGAPSATTYTYATSGNVTLSSNTPTRTGYTFLGWSTSSTATTASYSPGGNWAKSNVPNSGSTYTLYAVWQVKKLTIRYNKNDGSNSSSSETFTYDGNMDDNYFNPPSGYNTRTGYTFTGWSMKSDGSDNVRWSYNARVGESWFLNQMGTSTTKTIDVYAIWQVKKLTIRYNKNDGSNSSSSETFTYDGNMDDNYFNPPSGYNTRTGYTFTGWSMKSDGSDNVRWSYNVRVGESWFLNQMGTSTTKTIDVYAIWQANKIKITLNKNGGSGGTSALWYYYGTNKFYSNEACTTQITSISLPTKSGYSFNQYYGDGTSGGNNQERYIYDNGTFASDLVTDIYKNATLYAKWTENKKYTKTTTTCIYTSYPASVLQSAHCSNGAISGQTDCRAAGYSWIPTSYYCPYYSANLASNNRCYYTTTETTTETGVSSCTPQTEFSSCTYDQDGEVNISCTEE